ncbi:methyltransferase [Mycolicibacterium xanthum]|uniref:methyltransferase n=1 Tax=Mycolicibacterium xanthum TaxID=2796469 RepID=UPI003FD8FD3E
MPPKSSPSTPKLPPVRVARAAERVRHHVGRLYQRLAPPPITVIDIIFGALLSQAISASAQLGIADALAAGPLTKEELASRIGADPDSVARLMRLLISRGIFRRRRDGRFSLNALADTLRSDSPISVRGVALLYGSPQHRANWTRLADAVRTGEPNPPKVFGRDLFDYLRDDPEFAQIFKDAMTSTSSVLEAAVVAAYDFSDFGVIADIGAGHGRLLSSILAAAPDARGVLFDLPEAVEGAPLVLTAHGVIDRVTVTGGSFFESVPSADAYVMKNVIHDWPDDEAIAILGTIKARGPSGCETATAGDGRPGSRPRIPRPLRRYGDAGAGGRTGTRPQAVDRPTPAGRLPTAARGADSRAAVRHRSRAQLIFGHRLSRGS